MAEQDKKGEVMASASSLRKQHKEKKPGNRRWITLLAFVLVAGLAVGGYFLATTIKPAEPESDPADTASVEIRTLIDRTRDELASVTITQGETAYTLLRAEDGVMSMEGAPDFAMNQTKASSIAGSAARIAYTDKIEAPENLADFGLDSPQATAEVVYTDGETRTFLLGDQTPTASRYYLMEQGDPNVYIVLSTVGNNFLTRRAALHLASMAQVSADAVEQVTFERRGEDPLVIGYYDDGNAIGVSAVWLTEPILYEADTEKTYAFYESIAGISLSGFEVDATTETLAEYGLEEPRYHLIVLAQNEAGERVKQLELFIGDDKDENTTYARIDETNNVYLLQRDTLAFLADITPTKLVGRFANIINIQKVDGIEVVDADGKTDTFTMERTPQLDEDGAQKTLTSGQPAYDEVFYLNGEAVDDSTFRKLYQVLIGTLADGIIPDDMMPAEDAAPILTVTYRLNTERDREVIEYLPYDVNHYAVRRNGECLFYILKSRVDIIPEAIAAYEAGTFDPAAFGV